MSRPTYQLLHKILVLLHIAIDSYYFFILIPLNVFIGGTAKSANAVFFFLLALAQLPYKLRCPLTVWRSWVKQKIDPKNPEEESAIATLVYRMGFNKPTLKQVNIFAVIFGVFVTASFFV